MQILKYLARALCAVFFWSLKLVWAVIVSVSRFSWWILYNLVIKASGVPDMVSWVAGPSTNSTQGVRCPAHPENGVQQGEVYAVMLLSWAVVIIVCGCVWLCMTWRDHVVETASINRARDEQMVLLSSMNSASSRSSARAAAPQPQAPPVQI